MTDVVHKLVTYPKRISRLSTANHRRSNNNNNSIIVVIISAASIYLALMLYMSSLIYYSQKSYTIRYVQLLFHFTDEETEA